MNRIWLLAILVLAGCGQCNGANNPVSPDYPCGPRMHQCASGDCCLHQEVCGPDVASCPPGMCCASGEDVYGASQDGGTKGVAPQRKPGG